MPGLQEQVISSVDLCNMHGSHAIASRHVQHWLAAWEVLLIAAQSRTCSCGTWSHRESLGGW